MAHFHLPTTTTTLFLLILLLSPLTTTATVVDTDGNQVVGTDYYYILPVFRGRGGGLTLSPKNNTLCPLYVAQAGNELSQGLPVRFYPVNSKQLPITLSTDLNIMFDVLTICFGSTVWQLTSSPFAGSQYVVGVDGQIGNPGSQTLSNWFRIEKVVRYGDQFDYKIVFCPSVCETCSPVCGDVGVIIEDGIRFLGLNFEGQPLLVNFKRVSDHGTTSSI